MSSSPWTKISSDLGHTLWEVYQPRLGAELAAYASYTSGTTTITVVGLAGADVPLLRCESYDTGHEWTHTFFVPSKVED